MDGDFDFSGNLSFLNLGELLQLIGSSGASGTLRITSPLRSEPGAILIDNGSPVHATIGSQIGLEALFALFGWVQGRFEFKREAVACQKTITKGRMEIILDGLRLLDENKIEILGKVPEEPAEEGEYEAAERSDLPPLVRGPLVDYAYVVDEESYFDREEIVHEGAHGNWLWVILEGTAEIIKNTPKGPLKILRLGDGAFLGSIASLLSGENIRSSTVVASGHIQLGMLDSQLLSTELANLSYEFKSLIRSLDNRLRNLTQIASDAFVESDVCIQLLDAKKIAMKEGQNEGRMFRISEGEVVVARTELSRYIPLALLRKGDFFGNIPFLNIGHEPYAAAVFASPDLKLTTVDSDRIEGEHRHLSSTLRNLIEHLAACISATTLITMNQFKAPG
jgi:CRP-like cAMP-binding protein